jgi:hypothetical protein
MGTRPSAGLEAHHTAPGGRQADGAADVGAHVQRAIACGGRGAAPALLPPGFLLSVPGVACELAPLLVEAAEARRQHAVVRHRGLAQQHRTVFAQACSRRGVFGRGISSVAAVPSGSGRPRVAMFSFSVTGTPSSATCGCWRFQAGLEARAASSALSASAPRWPAGAVPSARCAPARRASPPPAKARRAGRRAPSCVALSSCRSS